MMRLIWPCSAIPDIKQMKLWSKEFMNAAVKARVKTPPTLPASELEGLCSVFKHFDQDASGELTLDELIEQGLIYEEQKEQYLRDWDRDGDGTLSLLEFCEMMCPAGYRAHEKALKGSKSDGTRVYFDRNLGGWRMENFDDEGLNS